MCCSSCRYLMETGEDRTRVYVDRWPAWLNLEDRVYRPPGTCRAALFGSRAGQMRQQDLQRPSSPVYEKAGKEPGGGTGGVQPVFQAGPGCKASAHDLFQHGIRVHDAGCRAYTDDGICAVL